MIDDMATQKILDTTANMRMFYAGFLASLLVALLMGGVVVPGVGLAIVTWVAFLDALHARRNRDRYRDTQTLTMARIIRRRANDPLNIDFH